MHHRAQGVPLRASSPAIVNTDPRTGSAAPETVTGTLGDRTVVAAPAARSRSIGQKFRAFVRRLAAFPVWVATCAFSSRAKKAQAAHAEVAVTVGVTQPAAAMRHADLRAKYATRLTPLLDRAVRAAKGSSTKVDKYFHAIVEDAVDFLRENKFSKEEASKLALALVRETTTEMVDDDLLETVDLGKLVLGLNRDTLKSISAKDDDVIFDPNGSVLAFNNCVWGQIGVRVGRSEATFLAAADGMKNAASGIHDAASAKVYIQQVCTLVKLWKEHLADCDMDSNIKLSDAADAALKVVTQQVLADCDKRVGKYLDELDSATLSDYARALGDLGLQDAQTAVLQAASDALKTGH